MQMLIAGSSMGGKTTWIFNLLKYADILIEPPPDRVVYCYKEYQPKFDLAKEEIKNIEFMAGLPPDDSTFWDESINNFLILDDLAFSCYNSAHIANIFCVGSHHKNLSVALLTQNLFGQGKESRNISLNSSYIIVFKNPRDGSQISYLSRQIFPNNKNLVTRAYDFVTKDNPFSYLCIDLKQNIHDDVRLRTNIFPHEGNMIFLSDDK